jgi:enterochelin esterase family protein
VFSQSGAYWRGNEGTSSEFEWVTQFVSSHAKLPVRFYLEVGAKETQRALGSGPVFVEANRRLVAALKAKGYDVTYREVPGAQHEPMHWRSELPAGLLHFWKRDSL